MVIAVIVAVAVDAARGRPAGATSSASNPTIVMLALGFLLMIGGTLIADGHGRHDVPKGYIYAAMLLGADRGRQHAVPPLAAGRSRQRQPDPTACYSQSGPRRDGVNGESLATILKPPMKWLYAVLAALERIRRRRAMSEGKGTGIRHSLRRRAVALRKSARETSLDTAVPAQKLVALRHQVTVLRRQPRPASALLRRPAALVWLYRIGRRSFHATVLIKPATVVDWYPAAIAATLSPSHQVGGLHHHSRASRHLNRLP